MIATSTMQNVAQSMRDLPVEGMIPVVGLLLVGLLLWAAGRRVLKAGMAAAGLLLGGSVGWLIGEAVAIPHLPPWIVALVLAIVLAAIGALAFRVAVAGTLAMVLAIGAASAVWGVAALRDSSAPAESAPAATDDPFLPAIANDTPDETEDPGAWLEEYFNEATEGLDTIDLATGLAPTDAMSALDVPEEAQEQIEALKSYADWAGQKFKSIWTEIPEELHGTMLWSAVTGLVVGFMLGALAPTISAAVVTSFGGALLMLLSTGVLAERVGIVQAGWTPGSPIVLLGVWIVLSLAGTVVQWKLKPKQVEKGQ